MLVLSLDHALPEPMTLHQTFGIVEFSGVKFSFAIKCLLPINDLGQLDIHMHRVRLQPVRSLNTTSRFRYLLEGHRTRHSVVFMAEAHCTHVVGTHSWITKGGSGKPCQASNAPACCVGSTPPLAVKSCNVCNISAQGSSLETQFQSFDWGLATKAPSV